MKIISISSQQDTSKHHDLGGCTTHGRVNQSLLSRLTRDDWDFDKINISQIESLSLIVPVPVIIVSMKTIGLETEEF